MMMGIDPGQSLHSRGSRKKQSVSFEKLEASQDEQVNEGSGGGQAVVSDVAGYFETSAEPEACHASPCSPTTAGAGFRSAEDDKSAVSPCSDTAREDGNRQPVAEDPDVVSFLRCVKSIAEKFVVLRKVGGGTFSTVYLAHPRGFPDRLLALKHIVPTSSPRRTENELAFLQQLGGKSNIVPILGCVREQDHVVLLMPFVKHERFSDYLVKLSVREASRYMAALFQSLQHVHSQNIIHRDIKPSNFLHDTHGKSYRLVDFGLAHEVGKDPLLLTINKPMRRSTSTSASATSAYSTSATRSSSSQRAAAGTTSSAEQRPRRSSSRLSTSPRGKHEQTDAGPLRAASISAAVANDDLATSPRKRKRPQSTGQGLGNENDPNDAPLTTSAVRKAAGSHDEQDGGARVRRSASGHHHGDAKRKRTDLTGGRGVGGDGITYHQRQRSLSARTDRDIVPSISSNRATNVTAGTLVSGQRRPLTYQGASSKSLAAAHPLTVSSRHRAHSVGLAAVESTLSGSKVRLVSLCPVGHKPSEVCSLCTARPSQVVTRAGTPGFRAPEVLVKYPKQTTAVDIWAAGVIFLCLLSSRYPFFKGQDDMTALAQIISLFGYESCASAFHGLGKQIICSPVCPPCDLRQICEKLRSSSQPSSLRRSPRKKEGETYTPLASDSTIQTLRANFKVHVAPVYQTKRQAGGARLGTQPPPQNQEHVGEATAVSGTKPVCGKQTSPSSLPSPPAKNTFQVLLPPSTQAVQAQKAKKTQQQQQETDSAISSSPPPNLATTAACLTPPDRRRCTACQQWLCGDDTLCWCNVPDSAYDLLRCCLDLNPERRITAASALSHPFIQLGIHGDSHADMA